MAGVDGESVRLYVVGWPHSGNRHLGRLLAHALDCQPPTFSMPWGPNELAKTATIFLTHYRAIHGHHPYFVMDDRMAYEELKDKEHIVWIIRDPRDTAISQWMSGRLSSKEGKPWPPDYPLSSFLNLFSTGHPDIGSCGWREYTEEWLEAIRRGRRIVRTGHEALVADREGELQRIIQVLGLQAEPSRIQEVVAKEENRKRRDYREPDKKDRWVKCGLPEWPHFFGTEEAWYLECYCGDLMRELGYGKEPEWLELLERMAR